MKRISVYFLCGLVICWVTVAVAWAIGLVINCAFIDECYEKLSFLNLMRLIDMKSVLARGTLLSLVFAIFAWAKIRHS